MCPFYRYFMAHDVCSIPDTLFDCYCEPALCEFEMGEWGSWRACANEVLAFVTATWRDDLTADQWYALALYWCRDDCFPVGIDELLDAAGWPA